LRPTEGMASNTVTAQPAAARVSAAISPDGPPPTTATRGVVPAGEACGMAGTASGGEQAAEGVRRRGDTARAIVEEYDAGLAARDLAPARLVAHAPEEVAAVLVESVGGHLHH